MEQDLNSTELASPSLLGVMRYRFHWISGKSELAEGKTVEEAFKSLGYGAGAAAALDYWEWLPPQSA